MEFVQEGHLGGYVKSSPHFPHGDPLTYCPAVWEWMIERFRPKTLLDVGAGEGHAVAYFRRRGIRAVGIEGSKAAIRAARGWLELGWLIAHDYAAGPVPPGALDLVDVIWSAEFVEHVEARFEENFLSTFDLARAVFMTHGLPGQPGYHHMNCRPPGYWIRRMAQRGFLLDQEATEETRKKEDRPDGSWRRTGLVFVKGESIRDPRGGP
jgi:SAM-dependent methyltransferase